MYNRILITGADGVIGRVLREELRGVYPVMRLSHRRPFGDPKPGEEIMLANLDNPDEVDALMDGVDAVIHLGGKAEEGTWDEVLKSNILGAFNTFEAARQAWREALCFCQYQPSYRLLPERPEADG